MNIWFDIGVSTSAASPLSMGLNGQQLGPHRMNNKKNQTFLSSTKQKKREKLYKKNG